MGKKNPFPADKPFRGKLHSPNVLRCMRTYQRSGLWSTVQRCDNQASRWYVGTPDGIFAACEECYDKYGSPGGPSLLPNRPPRYSVEITTLDELKVAEIMLS